MSDLARLTARATRVSDMYRAAFGIPDDPAYLAGKLAEEAGEVMGAHLRMQGLSRGADADPAGLRRALEDELAVLFGYLLAYCDRHGIDPAAAFERKWGRYLEETDDA